MSEDLDRLATKIAEAGSRRSLLGKGVRGMAGAAALLLGGGLTDERKTLAQGSGCAYTPPRSCSYCGIWYGQDGVGRRVIINCSSCQDCIQLSMSTSCSQCRNPVRTGCSGTYTAC